MEVNNITSPLTKDLVAELFEENAKKSYGDSDIDWVFNTVKEDFNNIQFLKNLSSKDRPRLASVEKDEDGLVVVDLTNPHILENMDYFRPLAITFDKTKKYTNINKNPHPLSPYNKFWKNEIKKSLTKVVREDGEWVPGALYWYWNFVPIYLTKIKKGSKKKRAPRVRKFPSVWDGDYFWYHYQYQAFEGGKYNKNGGQHCMSLKSRGKGMSNKEGGHLGKNLIIGASIDEQTGANSFALANETEYLTKDGILNKFVDNKDWCAKHTPFSRICKLKASLSDMHWKMGWKDSEDIENGNLNEIIAVTLKNDPDKARGKRGVHIVWEEVGKMPGFLTAWVIAQPSVEEGGVAFGQMVAYGTGGTEGANFYGAKKMFYEPHIYNVYGLPNVFDRKSRGEKKCAFFYPEYIGRLGCYDENGNSDVVKAMVEIYINRWHKRDASDPNAMIQEKAERPITPQEAIMRREGSIFPIADIRTFLENEISPKMGEFTSAHYTGDLVKTKDSVEFVMTNKKPLRSYDVNSTEDKEGAIEIFVMPQKGSNGEVPWGRYIAGIDPYDDDTGTSLGSILVFDLWTDRIVAEYTGRPRTAKLFFEKCLRILMFYNAQANYEQNKKGLGAYFSNNNALHYLCDTPQILRDMEYVKGERVGNKVKGTHATAPINNWGRTLQADWQINTREEEIADEDGNISTKKILNLHTIRSVGYLEECLAHNPDGNFDRLAAGNMLWILREDRIKITASNLEHHSHFTPMDDIFDGFIEESKGERILKEYYKNIFKKQDSDTPKNDYTIEVDSTFNAVDAFESIFDI